MAGYGILIRNADGDILIDGEHPHPILHEEETIELPAGSYGGMFFLRTFRTPSTHPLIIAWHSENAWIHMSSLTKRDNMEWSSMFLKVPVWQGPSSATYRAYTSPMPVPSMGDYGIDIFSSSGLRVFSGSQPTLRVHAMGMEEVHHSNFQHEVHFPPTDEKPFIFVATQGLKFCRYDPGHPDSPNYNYIPFIGPVLKNANGLWDRFLMGGAVWDTALGVNGGYDIFPLPYVVFT